MVIGELLQLRRSVKLKKARIYLVCNAHLDPAWLWEWPEGAAETVSTFRTAVELCEKNDTFVFNHNEAILYKWIQEYDPRLFQRIKKQVKRGRWHIMGGWYLQPDCNMLSGESFVRQILVGRSHSHPGASRNRGGRRGRRGGRGLSHPLSKPLLRNTTYAQFD